MSVIEGLLAKYAKLVLPGGKGGRLTVLVYHRILPDVDDMHRDYTSLECFRWQMQLLAQHFNVLPLSVALQKLEDGSLPEKSVSVTFDDGYKDVLQHAMPVMCEHKISSTIFVATCGLTGNVLWNDKIIEAIWHSKKHQIDLAELGLGHFNIEGADNKYACATQIKDKCKYLEYGEREAAVERIIEMCDSEQIESDMLTEDDLKTLKSQGVEFGAHTVTHPILTKIDELRAVAEITDSKKQLESVLESEISFFAYPNGCWGKDIGEEHLKMVESAGYKNAFTMDEGLVTRSSNPFLLPRYLPWEKSPLRFMIRLLLTGLSYSKSQNK